VIGGAQYPSDFPWLPNIFFERHVAPARHPHFYAAARSTLNITRAAMAACGWCPSGRLFEAAACATAILSDWWEGIDDFFVPGREVLIVRTAEDARAALDLGDDELSRVGNAARERVLAEHTAERRAAELAVLLGAQPGHAAARHQEA
jgi:spore maturation protein CgeB